MFTSPHNHVDNKTFETKTKMIDRKYFMKWNTIHTLYTFRFFFLNRTQHGAKKKRGQSARWQVSSYRYCYWLVLAIRSLAIVFMTQRKKNDKKLHWKLKIEPLNTLNTRRQSRASFTYTSSEEIFNAYDVGCLIAYIWWNRNFYEPDWLIYTYQIF